MRRILYAFILLLVLASTGVTQEYTSRYFHYDQFFDAPAPFSIRATTVDGADTNAILLAGGGAAGTTRGAYVAVYGNEYSGVGGLLLGSGNATGADIKLATGGVEHLSIPLSITAAATITYGLASDTSPSLILRSKKADGADDATVQLTSGGAWGTTRGAGIQLVGNDYGSAGAGAGATIETGTGTTNVFDVLQNGYNKLGLLATADADDVTLLLGANSTTAPIFLIRARTSDNDDDGILKLVAGGAAATDGSRGAQIDLAGNEAAGGVSIWSGSDGGHNVTIGTRRAAGQILLYPGNQIAWNFTGLSVAPVLTFGTSATSDAVATIKGARSDGSDDSTLHLVGGGALGTTRGASISLLGDDVGGAGAGAGMTLEAGTGTNGTIKFNTAGTNKWVINADGTLDSTVTDVGWRAAAAADQACTTTCGASKGCLFGLDAGTTTLVSCATATADTCICTTT